MSDQRFQTVSSTRAEFESLGPVVHISTNHAGTSTYRHEDDLWVVDDDHVTVHRGYFVSQLSHSERELISRFLRSSFEPIAFRYDGLTPNERELCCEEEFDWLVAWLGWNSK